MSFKNTDILLIGAGAMSATLGTLLKQLDPSLRMCMVERLDDIAQESSSGWNNAGTGHAAYCELNYTPQQADGSITLDKAYKINSKFEISLQFWSYLVQQKVLPSPDNFINPTPHISFVWGEENVEFLRKRYELMKPHHMFCDMQYSDDPKVLRKWMPLVMNGREPQQKVAGTRVSYGSDVDFASLSRSMVNYLQTHNNFELLLKHSVKDLKKEQDGRWAVTIKDKKTGTTSSINAGFVFIGAGGAALPLLQKAGIPEGKGYAGFPISGQWLVCKNPGIVKQHLTKVYGKAAIGAPPMSVPHLDTRVIEGEKALLFGPFAGFTSKFLKQGSYLDLFRSVRLNNLWPIIKVGLSSIDLIRYLIGEVLKTQPSRMKSLREYFPEADSNHWSLAVAGQRVQIIKKCNKKGGKLVFGTEMVSASDGTLATLLGASPGASVTVPAMLQVIEECFIEEMATLEWQSKLKEMIPSYGESLIDDAELSINTREHTLSTLRLKG